MKVSICGFTDLAKLPPELSTFLFCEYCKEPNLICAFHADLHYEYFKSKLSDILKILQDSLRIDDDNTN